MDPKALFSLSYGLYYIGTYGAKPNACVANTAIQVTSAPAKIAVTLNKANLTTDVIGYTGLFTVSVLDADAVLDDIARFGFKSGMDTDKFDGFSDWKTFGQVPYITRNTNAAFLVKTESSLDVGTHRIFVGTVEEAVRLGSVPSLTYADYHAKKNGVTPPRAPGFVAETAGAGKVAIAARYAATSTRANCRTASSARCAISPRRVSSVSDSGGRPLCANRRSAVACP